MLYILGKNTPPAYIDSFPSKKELDQIKDEQMRNLISKMLKRDPK